MPDLARLGIKVESDQVVQADRRLDRLAAAGLKAKRSTDQLGVGARGTSKSFSLLNAAFLKSPIALAGIAAGAAAVSTKLIAAASDAEETANKFNVVFAGLEDASEVALNLADNYGLAREESQNLLSSTADLLQGFGVSKEESLALSQSVQELAVDLASFTNYSGGATGASQALTKALLGERESVKSLGIAITDTELKQFAEDQGLVYNELSRAEKAFLTFELATKQSQNAIGDFERSEDSLANQTRIAKATISDIAVELGNTLLPAATSVTSAFNDLTSGIADNIRQTRELREALDLVRGRDSGDDLESQELLDRLETGYEEVTKRVETLRDKIVEFEQSNISQLRSQVPRLRELLAEEEAQQERLEARINLLSEEVAAELAVAEAKREEEEATKKLNEELKTQQELIEARYRAVRSDVVDILESEKSELQKLEEQYDVLAAHPWSSGQLENERLQAMEILLDKIQELKLAEFNWAEESEKAWDRADEKYSAAEDNFKELSDAGGIWEDRLRAISDEHAYGIITIDEYLAKLELLRTEYDQTIAKNEIFDQAIKNLTESIIRSGVNEFADSVFDIGTALGNGTISADTFGSAIGNVARQLLRMIPSMAIATGLQLLFNNDPRGWWLLGGGITGMLGAGFVEGAIEGSAQGNVFDRGQIQPFANGGIVTKPTLFPMAKGAGIMGEAGPEAIMPLTRTPSGELGVKSSGGNTYVTVINNSANSNVRTEEQTNATGDKEIKVYIENIVDQGIVGGRFDKSNNRRYGSVPKGVKV